MNRGIKKDEPRVNVMKLAPILLMLIVLLLTVGYSAFSDNMTVINIQAFVSAQSDIRITDFSLNGSNNGGSASSSQYGVSRVSSHINLPNSDSTVTYDIEVTNIGNVEMGIQSIIGLPSNLEYTLTGYNLETTLCDDADHSKCKLGSVTTFQITVGYANAGYDSNNTQYDLNLNFIFAEVQYVARIGNRKYVSLNAAVADVPTNNVETTIVLLKNTAERVAIGLNKNVLLDFPNLVISNNGKGPVFEVQSGTLKMTNGTITTTADQGAINVEVATGSNKGGTFIMTGGSIIASGNRQAIYINKGSATISGSAFLTAKAAIANDNPRGTVQTLVNGTLTITGGTVEATGTNGIALSNAGSMTIGNKDGNVSTSVPFAKSSGTGLFITAGSTVNFYDGKIAGETKAINNENLITDLETNNEIIHNFEEFDFVTHDTAVLGVGVTITFNPMDGSVDETERTIRAGSTVGALPIPTRTDYIFDGWFTYEGVRVTADRTESSDIVYYAHWTHVDDTYVAQIGSTKYHTLVAAISAVPSNTETTVELLRDTREKITIASSKRVVLDIQSYTLSNPDSAAVITVNGKLRMIGGTIETNSASTSAVNVSGSAAEFTITGGRIIATGKRQTIYNDGGKVTISGTAYLCAKALVESSNKRGTVQNLANSTLIITGGTIETSASNGIAVTNIGTATIGAKDGNITTTTPVIVGLSTGVNNTGTFKFYDGILKGQVVAANANPSDIEANSRVVNDTELIDGVTYNIMYLESTN